MGGAEAEAVVKVVEDRDAFTLDLHDLGMGDTTTEGDDV